MGGMPLSVTLGPRVTCARSSIGKTLPPARALQLGLGEAVLQTPVGFPSACGQEADLVHGAAVLRLRLGALDVAPKLPATGQARARPVKRDVDANASYSTRATPSPGDLGEVLGVGLQREPQLVKDRVLHGPLLGAQRGHEDEACQQVLLVLRRGQERRALGRAGACTGSAARDHPAERAPWNARSSLSPAPSRSAAATQMSTASSPRRPQGSSTWLPAPRGRPPGMALREPGEKPLHLPKPGDSLAKLAIQT